MYSVKRLTATITAHVNGLIDQIENHEAVTDAVLDDVKRSINEMRYQVARITNERKAFEKQSETLEKEIVQWKARALKVEPTDRDKAIDCMSRMNDCQKEVEYLRGKILEHSNLIRQLGVELKTIETRYEELKRRQSVLLARESRATVLAKMSESKNVADATSVFERWEKKIMHNEITGEEIASSHDSLAQEFETSENRQALEAELENLKKNQ